MPVEASLWDSENIGSINTLDDSTIKTMGFLTRADIQNMSSNKGVMDTSALIQGLPQPGLKDEGFALFRIGDALSSRDIPSAMFDALRLCHCL